LLALTIPARLGLNKRGKTGADSSKLVRQTSLTEAGSPSVIQPGLVDPFWGQPVPIN